MANSNGDLIAVFDADHAPARDFLKETVGFYAENKRLFLVQTPHFFLNPDPLERNLRTFERMPSENEMFYGIIQRGLDKWNAAFFCGSAALLNRTALNETGGFSGICRMRTVARRCDNSASSAGTIAMSGGARRSSTSAPCLPPTRWSTASPGAIRSRGSSTRTSSRRVEGR